MKLRNMTPGIFSADLHARLAAARAAISAVILAAAITGCAFLSNVFGIAPKLTILQGTTDLSNTGSTYDFGPVDPASVTGSTVSFTIRNDDNYKLSIDSVSVTDTTDYSVVFTKLSLDPGKTGTYSVTFKPTTNGKKAASITIVSGSKSAAIGVTGDGNSPPTVQLKIVVSGATTSLASAVPNGTYVWDPSIVVEGSSTGAFKMAGPTNLYVYYDPSNESWYLGDTPDAFSQTGTIVYYSPYPSLLADNSNWDTENQTDVSPALDLSTAGVTTGGTAYLSEGNTLTASVTDSAFHDNDGDAFASYSYEWQYDPSSPDFESGSTFSLPGTSNSYVINSADFPLYSYAYVRVVITPHATSGVVDGVKTPSEAVYISTVLAK